MHTRRLLLSLLVAVSTFHLPAQQAISSTGAADTALQNISPRLISFSDTVEGQPDGALTVTFAIYDDQQATTALWTETQIVQLANGKYTALLGAASPQGLPATIFAADQAHWLAVQANGVEKRQLLVSVPYAMKAADADRFGGLPPGDYVTVGQLQAILRNSAGAGGGTASGGTGTTSPIQTAAATGIAPQPATDFTDNNTTEVLLVTQQGTGYAIHAISAGDAALFAENNSTTGTAMKALQSATTGSTVGLLVQTASPDGIPAIFENTTGNGQILSLRSNGAIVVTMSAVGATGNISATGTISAGGFSGNGSELTNISPAAINAQSGNFPNSIVMRDFNGDFAAGQISAQNFIGSGFGLTNIPPNAVNAQPGNFPNSIVMRDFNGNFAAGQISAQNFIGSGFGLTNIPPNAVNAQPGNFPNSIVMRDFNGDFAAGQIGATNFIGNGFGLTNIPPAAVGAQSGNFPNAIVLRDASGNFSASGLTLSGNADFSAAQATLPVHAVLSINTPTSCQASRELLIKTDAPAGQQLFICNATGDGYVLVGDGTAAGVTGVAAGDGSVAIGGTAAQPTIAVAAGGITADKLAANAVTSSIADGSLSPAKVTGTAATLGSNIFTATQTMPSLNVQGPVNAGVITGSSLSASNGGFFGGPTSVSTATGTALSISGGDSSSPGMKATSFYHALDASSTSSYGVFATSSSGFGVHAEGNAGGIEALSHSLTGPGIRATVTGTAATAGDFNNESATGSIITGRAQGGLMFNLDVSGNVSLAGAHTGIYTNSPAGTTPLGLAKIDANGQAVSTSAGDAGGAVGVVTSGAGTFGPVSIAYAGEAWCLFDNAVHIGDYVQISRTKAAYCTDAGPAYPTSGQVIGRVLAPGGVASSWILLFGPEQRALPGGTITSINTGAGLVGGPIISSGTISIANAGVTNSMLQHSSSTVAPGTGLSGGGIVPLGGSVTLNNTGALSFNGRAGNVFSAAGDYSFSQLTGVATAAQLPADIAYHNQSNIFSTDQTIQGNLTTTGNISSGGGVTANSLSINDSGPANGFGPLSIVSQNNPAASLTSLGPTVFIAGNAVRGLMVLDSSGNLNLAGVVSATGYSGDGSGLTNVNASTIGGTSVSSLATNTALNAETAARQSADTTLQGNISAETSSRQSDIANLQSSLATESSTRAASDAALQTSISAETAARQSDVANLQTSINNVSAADAKLAASNTFTAGTQDFSGAGATLPVRAVLSANTPATCVAGKELLIKTDATAGQQLFICGGSGTTWDLVGDGAGGGVTSFNGRAGSVTPAANDYSFAQISGSAAVAQLPATVVYNNQANTLTGNQTVNGSVTATAFSGNGSSLTNVNAATLNGIPSNAFAQLNAINSFSAEQVLSASNAVNPSLNMPPGVAPATPLAGDIWNTGNTLQYRDTSSNTQSLVSTPQSGGFQLLKLTASITPAVVSTQVCAEQSFTVAGLSTTDLILAVAQPATKSPGTNIAIGGWRISAANTTAIQFCNVSRANSTPTAGSYTFAVMR